MIFIEENWEDVLLMRCTVIHANRGAGSASSFVKHTPPWAANTIEKNNFSSGGA